MHATSADIARRAGVSRATVSYVLNANPNQTISEATREAVLKAALELDYRPNVAARALRSGRGSAVLFPMPGMDRTHVVSQLTLACQQALEEAGLALVVDYGTYETVDAQLDAWLKHAPAAVIDLLLRHDDPVLEALRLRGVRVLSAGLGSDSTWESTSDTLSGLVRITQVQHLLDQGARHVELVLPPRLPADPRMQRRMLKSLRDLATAAGARFTVSRTKLDVTAVRRLVGEWVSSGAPDAVAAYNDDYGIAISTALIAGGCRVPEDVLVVGVDDLPLSSLLTPSLTSIAADFDDYARVLAEAVLCSLDGRPLPDPLPTPSHHLVVRESTTTFGDR